MLKRVLTVTVSILLLLSCIVMSASCGKEDYKGDFDKNWDTDSGRYSKTGRLINGSKGNGVKFETDNDGGIHVTAGEGKGYVPTTILKSKNKTSLDGLTVKIDPKKMDFTDDNWGRSQLITVMWTVDPIKPIDEALKHFDYTATNGIRNTAEPTKGLCIVLNNTYDEYFGTMTASNLMITLIDGDFHDVIDSRLGYRWSFTARNFLSQSPFSDDTGIVSRYEKIDISDGLTVSVRADDEHGYIVSVNGVDYYDSYNIAYYPNNESDYHSETSMTFLQNDIDLTPLVGAGDGYLNIAVSGNLCKEGLEYDYTVSEINGVPAATWSGEKAK